jgi:hypothetical protein
VRMDTAAALRKAIVSGSGFADTGEQVLES